MAIKKYHESDNLISVNSFVNSTIDSRPYFSANIRSSNNETIIENIYSSGRFSLTITLASDADILFRHNGFNTNIPIFKINNMPAGTYTVSFTVNGYNPSVEGGLNLSQIMLNKGSAPLPYEPYFTPYFSDEPYREYGTETDTITSLPKQIIGDGQAITSCQISGNMVQNGTPTPSDPIYPEECGDRTGNLFDKDATDTNNGYVVNKFLTSSGDTSSSTLYNISEYIELSPRTVYTVFIGSAPKNPSICFYDTNKNYIEGIAYNSMDTITVTTPANAKYCRVSYVKELSDVSMLNLGSTALPYEPYGYKLPLTVNGTEYPIYFGQIETTRRIRKLVLTGAEGWASSQSNDKRFFFMALAEPDYITIDGGIVCSHFEQAVVSVNNSDIGIGPGGTTQIRIRPENAGAQSGADFSSWVATQYNNGTPVTVWYVLAEPETAIVNEPIRKIGDYADTVAATNIPTTGTAENFDVETTLKPSEVQLTYHGWHEHEDTKFMQGE